MIIYKTTNTLNGKIYIGQDTHDNPKYFGSGFYIKRAIKKYGKENFNKEKICECSTQEDLDIMEIYWISELNSRDPKIGYNIAPGGNGGDKISKIKDHDPERYKRICEKIADASRKRKFSDEVKEMHRKRILGDKNPSKRAEVRNKIKEARKYQICSEETRKKKSESMKGKNTGPQTKQHIENRRLARIGMKDSEETKKRKSLARIGMKDSEETKKRKSLAQKKRFAEKNNNLN